MITSSVLGKDSGSAGLMTSGVTDVACIGLDVAGGGCAADGGEAYAVVHGCGDKAVGVVW